MEKDLFFRYRTKNDSTPYGKPRVFFTCHHLDFDSVFDQICSDIFETQDCTVFYSEDMEQALSTEIREKMLTNMNLFLIPITARLLTEPNRALDDDFRFAIERNIPVLPIIMETGIEYLYSKIDAISNYQYLNKTATDITEIEYKTKLKRFLEDILLNDDKIEQIRKSFSAYFFLSYRKKDRDKANALIQLIHEMPDYWDVAIWYDEFLLFGSDYHESIIDALTKSNLFILLITPNILQKTGYDYNFIVREEYPLAVKKGKAILPVIAEKTNLQELNSLFLNIPSAVSIHDKDSIRDSLNRYLPCRNSEETQEGISKKYNLGLAYLNGVDVEINTRRGIALITEAAEAGSTEAAYQLYRIYTHAIGTERDFEKAFDWITLLTLSFVKKYGTLSEYTRPFILTFIDAAFQCNKYDIAKTVAEKVYSLAEKNLGESHPFSIECLKQLIFFSRSEKEKEQALKQKLFRITLDTKLVSEAGRSAVASEQLESKDSSVCDVCFDKLFLELDRYIFEKKYEEAIQAGKQLYNLIRKIYGNMDLQLVKVLTTVATVWEQLSSFEEMTDCLQEAYDISVNALGEQDEKTLLTLAMLASAKRKNHNYDEGLRLGFQAYQGLKSNQSSLYYLEALTLYAATYDVCLEKNKEVADRHHLNYAKEINLYKELYDIRRNAFGDNSQQTIHALLKLRKLYQITKKMKEKLEVNRKIYEARKATNGQFDDLTLAAFEELVYSMGENGFLKEAADGYESLYKIYRNIRGQFHGKTMWALSRAAIVFRLFKQYDHALELLESLYNTVTDPRLSHVNDRNLKGAIWCLRQMSEILIIIGKDREAKEKLEQIRLMEQAE